MIAAILATMIRVFTGVRVLDSEILQLQHKVFYSAHSSHFDFLTIWASLPSEYRQNLRPVAAKDYWGKTKLRRFFSQRIIRAILIDRSPQNLRNTDPITPLTEALKEGDSLLLFPEGTRGNNGDDIAEFKSGIYRLAIQNPSAHFIPVKLENLGRILPKGEFLPLPIIARIEIFPAITIRDSETKKDFLTRTRAVLTSDNT